MLPASDSLASEMSSASPSAAFSAVEGGVGGTEGVRPHLCKGSELPHGPLDPVVSEGAQPAVLLHDRAVEELAQAVNHLQVWK
jgi:hypothetical protein